MLLELPVFKHVEAHDVAEAVSCLRDHAEKARVIAGATDLLGLMKDRIDAPEVLVNIKDIPGMAGITYDEKAGLRIGAAATLARLAAAEVVRERFPIIVQAALQVGTTQLRNMGTVGGNLCQRPRCAYFRHPHFDCFKKGGTRCFALAGEHRFYHAIMQAGKCVMAHPSDMAPPLIALKAAAVIAGPEGERKISLASFFQNVTERGETSLKPGELLVAIEVPPQETTCQLFVKHRIRRAADFALSSVALVARVTDGTCADVSVVLGGVAPAPYVASGVEAIMKGRRPDDRLAGEAAEAAVKGARPLPMNGYKVDLTKTLVKRALMSMAG